MLNLTYKVFFIFIFGLCSCSLFKAPFPQDQLKNINWYAAEDPLLPASESMLGVFDLDGNKYPDLMAWDFANLQLIAYLQKPTASGQSIFSREIIALLPQKPDLVAFGDFDQNKKREMAVSFGEPLFSLGLIKEGAEKEETGLWTFQALSLSNPVLASKLLFNDVNGDGFLDLVASNMYSELNGGIRVVLLTHEGKAGREIGPTSYHLYSDIAVLDFNGDKIPDIAGTTIGFKGQVYIWQGDGKGGFKQTHFSCPAKDYRQLLIPTDSKLPFQILALTGDEGLWGWSQEDDEWIKIEKNRKNLFYESLVASNTDDDEKMDLVSLDVIGRHLLFFLSNNPTDELWTNPLRVAEDIRRFFINDMDQNGKSDLVVENEKGETRIFWQKEASEPDFPSFRERHSLALRDISYNPSEFSLYQERWLDYEDDSLNFKENYAETFDEVASLIKKDPNIVVVLSGFVGVREKLKVVSPMNLSRKRTDDLTQKLIQDFKVHPKSIISHYHSDNTNEEVKGKLKISLYLPVEAVFIAKSLDVAKSLVTGDYDLTQYIIGNGDILKITLRRESSISETDVVVTPTGEIILSLIGGIPVAKLSLIEARDLIEREFSKYFIEPKVEVRIKNYYSQAVTLFGAINEIGSGGGRDLGDGISDRSGPGVYYLSKPTRILEFISSSGGFTNKADLRRVTVSRKNGSSIILDLQKVLTREDVSSNLFVLPGDLIYVPEQFEERLVVSVFGQVKAPGSFPYKEGWKILDLISKAGGPSDFADARKAKLIRTDTTGTTREIFINVEEILDGEYEDNIPLAAGDIVFVP